MDKAIAAIVVIALLVVGTIFLVVLSSDTQPPVADPEVQYEEVTVPEVHETTTTEYIQYLPDTGGPKR